MSDFRPHSDEAEQWLLGALMRSPGCLDSAGVDVSPDHFFSAAHQSIYRKILALSADGKACDALSVSDALESAGTLGQVGGMAYLMEIEVAAPPPSAARRHAEIVVERAMLRELLAASAEIEDHATWVDPSRIASRPLDQIRPGGLGVHLIQSTMDDVAYTRNEHGGTTLRLVKRVAPAEDPTS